MQQPPQNPTPTSSRPTRAGRLPDPLHMPRVLPKIQPPTSPFLATAADDTLSPAPLARNAWSGRMPDLPSIQPLSDSTVDPRDLHLDYLTPRSRSLSMATTVADLATEDWGSGFTKALPSSPLSSVLTPTGIGELRRARRQSRRQFSLVGESSSSTREGASESTDGKSLHALPPLPPLPSLTQPTSGRLASTHTSPWSIPSASDRISGQRRASRSLMPTDSPTPYSPAAANPSPFSVPASSSSLAGMNLARVESSASPSPSVPSRALQRRKSQLDLVAAAMAEQEGRQERSFARAAASGPLTGPSGTGVRGAGKTGGL